jgi:hypothetical protein
MNANIVTTNVTYMNLFTTGLGINGPAQAGTSKVGAPPFFTGGTLSGTAVPVNDAPTSNLALRFGTATSSYVNMGTTSPPHVDISTTSIFVEAWIYATTTSGLIDIASYGAGTLSGWYMQVRPDAGGFGSGLYVGNSRQTLTAAGAFVANQWNYVAFQINGGGNDSRIYGWISQSSTSGTPFNTGNAGAPAYSAADSFYIGAVNGSGGLADGNSYIQDMRIISGSTITTTGSFTAASPLFTASVPSYVTGTGLSYVWGLQASSNLYQNVLPLVKVAGNVFCSNTIETASGQFSFTNVLAVTTNLASTATARIFSPAAGGIVGIGQVPTVGAATLQVTGNVFAANALQSSNINTSSWANTALANIRTITNSTLRIGVNNAAPTSNLTITGNVFASNALQSANVSASTSANTASSNIRTITNSTLRIGVNNVAPTANLTITGNVFASNALQSANILATSANAVFSNVTSNNIGYSIGINKASPSSNLDVSGNVLVTDTVTASGIDQQLPVTGFTGTGVAGAYTSTTNGVTFTVGATSETTGHEAWRAVNAPATVGSGLALGKFQLYERDSMAVGNQLWSPNGRYYYTVNSTTHTIQDYYLSTTPTSVALGTTITSLYLTTAGFLQGVNSAGAVVYTSPNTATGYGPYRFAIENQGFAAIYDRYNTILYQLGTTQTGWQTSGTYGGDTVTTSGGYRIHTFTTVGSQRFVIPNYLSSLTVDYLIVAGGGGGGFGTGGGGGAGGLIAATAQTLSNGVYTVTVGGGGAGAATNVNGGNGGNSALVNTVGGTVISPTAIGGGGGVNGTTGVTGGSGGGGSGGGAGGAGTVGQGNAGGGSISGGNFEAGGGGGAGAVGGTGIVGAPGVGGDGLAYNFTGSTVYYAGGGGGGWNGSASGAAGGLGGGGAGGQVSTAGTAGTGGGGGGGNNFGGSAAGAAGGSGIVIIRYLINPVQTLAVSGYTYVPFSAIPAGTFTLTASGGNSNGNAWYVNTNLLYDGSAASGGGSVISLSCTQPSDIYSTTYPGTWYTLTSGGLYARHSGFNMSMTAYTAGNYDFAWQFYLKNGTTDQVIIRNPYPGDAAGYWVQSNLTRIRINTADPTLAQIYTISQPLGSVSVSNAWGGFWTVPQTLTFSMPTLYLPRTLLIQGVDYNNSPYSANAFTFSGSTDGTTYNTLVSSSTFLSNTDYGYNIYSITTNTAWKYFQLQITGADSLPAYVNQMILNGQISWSPTANAVRTNVTTANVLMIEGKVGVGTSTNIGATLQVNGNLYASNSLFGTIRSPLMNITTLNTTSIYGTSGVVGVATVPTAGGAVLQIPGNVYASNALFGNILSTTGNTTTLNTTSIYGTSGVVGVATVPTAGGAVLQIPGNVYASNTLSGQNVIVTTIQSYNEDLTRWSPHLIPSDANYISIENWMMASCNTTQKVGWSVASVPTFNNATVGVTGSALYSSSLLAPNGRVYFTPASATNIGVFNPMTNEFSTIVPVGGTSLAGTFKYGSSVLCPNGNIFFISNASTTSLIFNPLAKTATNSTFSTTANYLKGGVLGGTGAVICPPNVTNTSLYRLNPLTGASLGTLVLAAGYTAAVLTPTGNIVCVPSTATTIRVVNSTATSCVRSTTHSQTTPAYAGGVLVPDGNVVCVPYSSLNVTLYDPVSATLTQVPHGCGSAAFSGGVLLPTGNVVFIPYNAINVGMFDPVAQTYSNLVSVGSVAGKYSGGTLLPDGRVIMAQYNASNVGILNTITPASVEFCRSPYFNKF